MDRPVKAKWREEKQAVELVFEKDVLPSYLVHEESGRLCQVRGGITWPEGKQTGYVIVGAQDLQNGVIRVYEETPFQSVSLLQGKVCLCHFLEDCWKRYFVRTFYYESSVEEFDPLHRRYLMQVIREPLINPKPVFLAAVYVKMKENADALLYEYQQDRKIRIERGGGLYRELQGLKGKDVEDFPAVRALRCLLAGYERSPWREPKRDVI